MSMRLHTPERKHFHAQTNAAGQRLECSHFQPAQVAPDAEPLPIVVYCHCNSGSRRDAEEAVLVLLPHHISVFALDFAVRLLETCIGREQLETALL